MEQRTSRGPRDGDHGRDVSINGGQAARHRVRYFAAAEPAFAFGVVLRHLVPSSLARGVLRSFGLGMPIGRYVRSPAHFPVAARETPCRAIVCHASRNVTRHFNGPSRWRELFRRFACSNSASM